MEKEDRLVDEGAPSEKERCRVEGIRMSKLGLGK